MFNLKIIVSCIFISCIGNSLSAQPLSFDHLTTLNGLNTNSVNAITQDYRGFMWFACSGGVARYDGVNFRKYFSSQKNSISSDYIFSIFADSKKNIWIGTADGLDKLNIETNEIEKIPVSGSDNGISNKYALCFCEDRESNLWVGTSNGLNLLTDRTKNSFIKFYADIPQGIANNQVECLFEDDEGSIWIGTDNGLSRAIKKNNAYQFETFRNDPNNKTSLSSNNISAIAEDVAHNIWIGTINNGLNLFDKTTGTISPVQIPGITDNVIKAIKSDHEGKLWIGAAKGVFIIDPVTRSGGQYQSFSLETKSLKEKNTTSIFQDAAGSVWIGTFLGGLTVAHPQPAVFSTWQSGDTKYNLSNDVVTGITEDEKQNLVVATAGGGLNYINRKTGIITRYKHELKNPASIGGDFLGCVYKDPDGDIWVGTTGGGLNLFNSISGTFTRFIYDPANPATSKTVINTLFEDSQQRFWVGTENGLKLFKKFNHSLAPDDSVIISGNIATSLIYPVMEDSRNNIWVGTVSGLYMLKKNEKNFNLVKDMQKVINCLYEDKEKHVWIGIYNEGLTEYNQETGEIKQYTINENVPGNQVLSILGDDQDNLWLATDIGLCRFNPNDSTVRIFNTGDEAVVGGSIRNSFYKSANQEFFFGGQNGFVSFFPDKIHINKSIAPMVFTYLQLFNNQGDSTNGVLKDISITDKIQLRYNQNSFSIRFALLSYSNSEKNRYAYKLAGLDKDWIRTSYNFVNYPYLPSGKYTLLVKGANSDGTWSKPIALKIEILPPVWKTWWAYLLYLSVLVVILYFVMRFYFLRELKNKIKV